MLTKQTAIQNIRAFNRFYTDVIGLLNKHLLDSDYSLAEVRVMYEISVGKEVQASQIMAAMSIDKSYLSRILKKLEKDGIITKSLSPQDARALSISLTAKGKKLFDTLNKASDHQIGQLIETLSSAQQQELVSHMHSIISILNK
ncbi:MarR family transcriptional regulator [Chitinophaga oryziterrae]|uniref:MarR family transcriptional regulator n=1 Tax=Chitinophaga oryziterrae TaxID=1031224 RepID=A0A6N8J534_9BACT|nr:MarR family transcriptional regulator [Chitinophaga oryziterrae]MVT40153.1 MarR family transcriptional regulator [Chitinophaga oryziterrae]